MKLDLHGKSHYDVSNLLDQFIWESMKLGFPSIEVVTGNSQRMKNVVIDVISEYQFSYEVGNFWNSGYIRIFLK
jgi:DNA-nicking Smr family endonuclease